MDEFISIGQFAALTWLSPKALRLYQSQGLLEPARVDPTSGYRYYAASQIPTASLISLLRRAGVSLAHIAGFLDEPTSRVCRSGVPPLNASSRNGAVCSTTLQNSSTTRRFPR